MKSELPPRWDGTPRFAKREPLPIEVPWSDAEKTAHKDLNRYTRLRLEGASSQEESFATEFVLKLLKKRLFSCPEAFRSTLEGHIEALHKGGAQKPVRAPSVGILRRMVEGIEEDYADDEAYEEAAGDVLDTTSHLFRALSDEEDRLLKGLKKWAEQASRRPDTKAATLIDWLKKHLHTGGDWNDQRVILFTEYRATQKWLQGLLAAEGFGKDERLLTIYGGMRTEDRERVKAAFQAAPTVSPVRILLATDAASEGIDLQNHCSLLIHYEIPWNPNRMEQRNGRIDRHGQKASKVLVHHFVGEGWDRPSLIARTPGDLEGDLEFLMRAALKVETIREDLGKVGPVIAAQVEEAMLGRRRTLDTDRAQKDAEPARRLLKIERKLREQLQKLDAQLKETRTDLRMLPDNVQAVVEEGLALAGQPALTPTRADGVSRAFRLPALRGSWALCAEGLDHPHTHEVRPIVFDHDLAAGRDDVVLCHLNHRLVQMCLRLLRAEIWAPGDRKKLQRVTARAVPGNLLDMPAVVAHGRLVVLGADNTRLHEEVIQAGGLLREGRFQRIDGVNRLAELVAAGQSDPVPGVLQDRFRAMWSTLSEPLYKALETRMADRTESLGRQLAERSEKEIHDITVILTELKRSIEAEFDEPDNPQIPLFSLPEREQLERNRDALRARVAAIPAEIARETQAISDRYASPTSRLFPVAVTFLVPEPMCRRART
jgi:hypothetical protein